jgi:hypothetical protein
LLPRCWLEAAWCSAASLFSPPRRAAALASPPDARLALLAEAYGHAGRFHEALERLADADTMIETTQEAWPAAEVHRLRGQVLITKMNDRAAAEDSFCRAIDAARRLVAKCAR